MKKLLPLVLACALPATAAANPKSTTGFDASRLHAGAGIGYHRIDSPFIKGSDSEPGINLFVGYELKTNIRDVKTSIEAGYSKTDEFYGKGTDISGLWAAGVMEKDLPEINPSLFVIGRIGMDFGDDDGILIGAGAGMHLNRQTDVRGEFINKDSTSVFQVSLVLQF